jgi:predicted transposase YbfD/YdcC
MSIPGIDEHFLDLEDPRVERTRRHDLREIVVIAMLAVICGADHWAEIVQFGRAREKFLRGLLPLRHGIPGVDTFRRVFAALDTDAFTRCFTAWTETLAGNTEGVLIAVDGKTLRRSFTLSDKSDPRHIVSAWAAKNRVVLAQVTTEAKSNEITAIPRLLALLNLTGATITIDAMGCQTAIADGIRAKGADYVLGLKNNQPTLYSEVEAAFATVDIADEQLPAGAVHREDLQKVHGRTERRTITVLDVEDRLSEAQLARWTGLQRIIRVESDRVVNEEHSQETRYYISSRVADAASLAAMVRGHWGIENGQHWVLDMAFDEDRARTRKKNAPDNFALLRRIALNVLAHDKSKRVGTHGKRLKAGWDDEYLLSLLEAAGGAANGDTGTHVG